MLELLAKIPVNAEELSGINVYEHEKLIDQLPGEKICEMRSRISICVPICPDDFPYMTPYEMERFLKILREMIKCNE